MILQYKIREEDYLTHQLYMASKSKSIKRKRITFWIIVPFAYALFAYLSYFDFRQPNMAYVMVGLAFFWFILYPFYSKWNYKRHYSKHINENLKGQFDQLVKLELNDQNISIKDEKGNKSEISFPTLKEIIEIPEHFLIKLTSNSSIILPKKEFSDIKEVQKFLGLIVKRHNIPFCKETQWKWK